MSGPNAAPQIPDTWRDAVISPNPDLEVAMFYEYIRTREQIFEMDIGRIHSSVTINLMVSFFYKKLK